MIIMYTNSIFLASTDDSKISDNREISFNFKIPENDEASDISTIDKYKIEFSNDHATFIPLDYNTS